MKHLMAKIMVFVACAIIMLHAVVPHHHHDCCEAKGFTFETELACHCHCDCDHHDNDHHSHHPFNICLLQEMLSQLVISTSDDHLTAAAIIKAEANHFIVLAIPCLPSVGLTPVLPVQIMWWPSGSAPLTPAPVLGANGLRAPPFMA